jgi:hypothetical protein
MVSRGHMEKIFRRYWARTGFLKIRSLKKPCVLRSRRVEELRTKEKDPMLRGLYN